MLVEKAEGNFHFFSKQNDTQRFIIVRPITDVVYI